MNIERDYFFI